MKSQHQLLLGIGVFAVLVWLSASLGASHGSTVVNVVQESTYKEFDIVMRNNRYDPSKITVNQNDQVVINLTNLDQTSHGVGLPEFGASIPGGHLQPGQTVQLNFIALKQGVADAATCGGGAFQQTDTHGEELIIEVL